MNIPDRVLTARFNNILTLGLGLPAVALVVWATGSGAWAKTGGLVVLGVFGSFW